MRTKIVQENLYMFLQINTGVAKNIILQQQKKNVLLHVSKLCLKWLNRTPCGELLTYIKCQVTVRDYPYCCLKVSEVNSLRKNPL